MSFLRTTSPHLLGRLLVPALMGAALTAPTQEKPVVTLQDLVSAEVRHQGFTLPRPLKVHVYARGGGLETPWGGERNLFAYGWILKAGTREVVWQMSGANSRREGPFRIADQYVDLPAGAYEAYFSNHAFGRDTLFSHWNRNIDRRRLAAEEKGSRDAPGFLRFFGADTPSQLRIWRERAKNYGLMLSLPAAEASQVTFFEAPLLWKDILVSLTKVGDNGQWSQAFRVKKPVSLHVYAQGEGGREGMNDTAWILDARTRKRVWEMDPARAQYAGGASKNLRQVETLQLPPGDYVASFATDDSHSPADWNAAPPCDPLLYGLTLALPNEADRNQVALMELPASGPVLAELVRVKNAQDLTAPFSLAKAQAVRVYALGESSRGRMADGAWIEDAATGKPVWTMEFRATLPAGGALKNRMADERVDLPKGNYLLHFKTDDSHAYGDWNAAPPRDPEHYGVTVYVIAR